MKNLLSTILISLITLSTINSQVVLNEFSAANRDQFFDEFGEDEDWIELYNTSSSAIDISGYYLSDRSSNPDKWTFPSGTIIEGTSHLLIWASGKDLSNHTNFKITQTKNNEAIVFSDPSGNIIDINEIDVPNQLGDSWARDIDGTGNWAVARNPTPGEVNGATLPRYASDINIKPASGSKTGPIEISIEADDLQNGVIYYTLDGTVPTPTSLVYTDPFTATSTSIVRARVYENNIRPGRVETNTYLINENHSIPIISIAGNEIPDLLDGNFIEPIGSFELFDRYGEKIDEAVGDFNKHGNDSWAYPQRGVDYITRDQYGYDSDIDGKLFNVSDRTSFQRLILKAAANDNVSFENGAHIRDAYVHTLSQLANMEMDERSYEPCILYVNGVYWGVYEYREKVDDHDYTEYYYNQEREDIDFIKTWGITYEEYGSWDDWYLLRDYITNNDMSDPDNYAYVEERFNLLSLLDYMIIHSFNVSADWLNWNTAWWRGRNADGGAKRWRYILWDEDASFNHYINYSNVPTQDPDADPCDFEELESTFTDFEGHIGIFTKLFDSPDFVELYINRYADLNNTYLSCDFTIPLLDSLVAQIEPEMPRQLSRWGGSMTQWQENVQQLRDFILTRCTVLDEGIVDCYEDEGITGPYDITINVSPSGTGKVKANTLVGLTYPWEGTYFGGITVSLEAIPNEGNNFLYWEVNNNVFGLSEFDQMIEMEIDQNDVITAYFSDVPCLDPTDIIINTAPGMAFLEWNGGGGVTYEVNYKLQGTSDWEVLSSLNNEITLNDLSDCTTYDGRIRTICANTNTDFINFTFSSWCTTDTDDLLAAGIQKLKTYPIPFTDIVNLDIQLTDAILYRINVFDHKGSHIQSYNSINNGKVKLENWGNHPSGIYHLQIITSKGGVSQKLIKI